MPATLQKRLYRQLVRSLWRMRREGLPCTGCVGLPAASQLLCPAAFVAAAFRADGSAAINDAFYAIRMLARQLSVLQASEDDTRAALSQWQRLQQQWCASAPLRAGQQLEAAEEGAWLLHRLATQQAVQQLLLEEEVEERQQASEGAAAAAKQRLDELAAAVRDAAPGAFADQQRAAGAARPASQRLQQLHALSEVLFQRQPAPLRCRPFEWVYDGLSPLLLPDVLERRTGCPLAVAVAAGAVARRLGVHARLVCAGDAQAPGTASGPLLQQQLPPEVAARQAGRSLASPPTGDAWFLQLLAAPWEAWQCSDACLLDVAQGGRLLTEDACLQRYPSAARELRRPGGGGGGADAVAAWSALARTMVLAHQRRGESDLVAHWLYQVMALDATAPEWSHMLGGQAQ